MWPSPWPFKLAPYSDYSAADLYAAGKLGTICRSRSMQSLPITVSHTVGSSFASKELVVPEPHVLLGKLSSQQPILGPEFKQLLAKILA